MAKLQVEIVPVGTEGGIPIQEVVLILNRTQDAFRFTALGHGEFALFVQHHGPSFTTREIYSLLGDFTWGSNPDGSCAR